MSDRKTNTVEIRSRMGTGESAPETYCIIMVIGRVGHNRLQGGCIA